MQVQQQRLGACLPGRPGAFTERSTNTVKLDAYSRENPVVGVSLVAIAAAAAAEGCLLFSNSRWNTTGRSSHLVKFISRAQGDTHGNSSCQRPVLLTLRRLKKKRKNCLSAGQQSSKPPSVCALILSGRP